ncbi:MAG: hypothetical protein LQ350_002963 [Teloschistes chrysophthalmus]|nr:MAG: hypothetical protein LQ350_002963 [Niorma chrysophthalma]
MAPDRGSQQLREEPQKTSSEDERLAVEETQRFLAQQAEQAQNFTTGWISGMTMPASLIGFAFFKTISRYLKLPFTPVENVLVQTVATAVGTMPLGCGFVGVIPALNYLLEPEENGPLQLSAGKLILWSLGICFFGVVFAVPLRREVIVREKLKFPSGTATALVISVLHGGGDDGQIARQECGLENARRRSADMLGARRSSQDLARRSSSISGIPRDGAGNFQVAPQTRAESENQDRDLADASDWKAKIRLLAIAFGVSAVYTLSSYFIPHLHDLPIFGLQLAHDWLWTFNPSPAYAGQGIIMGPATTLHMLLGAVVGWGILSPLAKSRGWASGNVDDWTSGSKGWIVWVSLAIMLADSIVSLGWLVLRPVIAHGPRWLQTLREHVRKGSIGRALGIQRSERGSYTVLASSERFGGPNRQPSSVSQPRSGLAKGEPPEPDAPPAHLIANRTVLMLLILSIAFCVFAIRIVFDSLIPFYAIFLAIVFALLLSVMGVRAQGETDLNPVSGISKLTQLAFALVIPSSNPNAVTINLLAGAISESGALQAGDLMQDLKAGHLLGASPKAQFWGQIIGSAVGAVVSAGVYKLYTTVYEVPGGLFQVPTGYVWIFTARLVTGKGLPHMAWQWAVGAGCIFAALTVLRIKGQGRWWQAWVPGGIAVAVGSSQSSRAP